MLFNRLVNIPESLSKSFFLWGPRQAGKTFFLRNSFPDCLYIDLLNSSEFIKYTNNPSLLSQELALKKPETIVIIDEIQKVPALLDEVHRIIEQQGTVFGLCGSSARKLKRGHANMLGGRALRYELFGLVTKELSTDFDLIKLCNRGNIPNHYLSDQYWDLLDSYVSDYLKEEILAESLVRNLPSFSDFLRAAAICDTELIDYTNIASDCGVKSPTVKNYYEIMSDTLQGFFLPSYSRRPKRKIIHAPKFYFANVGVVNKLAKRRMLEPGSEMFGKAFENVLVNEIRAWNSYLKKDLSISYWKLASGAEVDLVIEDLDLAIEIKSSAKITPKHLSGLNELAKEHPRIKRRVVVCLESVSRLTDSGIYIYSYQDFLKILWENRLEALI
jgi:predicted AAA+ superfamily ATPase